MRKAQVQAEKGVRSLCPDWTVQACPSVQVKRAVVQVISAMAHHGYLEQPGGEAMLEYIVQQCALLPEAQVRGPPPAGLGPVGSAGEWAPEGAWPQVAGRVGPAAFLESVGASAPQWSFLRQERWNRHGALFKAFLFKMLLSKPHFSSGGRAS